MKISENSIRMIQMKWEEYKIAHYKYKIFVEFIKKQSEESSNNDSLIDSNEKILF